MFYDAGGQIMSLIRTDLALEAHESAARSGKPDGVVVEKFSRGGINVSRVKVIDERGEQAIGKPVGTYVTVETGKLDNVGGDEYNKAVEAVADEIKEILKPFGGRCAKIVDSTLEYQIKEEKQEEAYRMLKDKGYID